VNDLKYEWKPNPAATMAALLYESVTMGTLEHLDEHRATIEIGIWDDIYIRCTGKGATKRDSLAQALARARWVHDRLHEPPEGLESEPEDDSDF